eukprot:gb/GECH01012557.1/.p1 GENE.gb/GECH01012557.1/~~gb/GECH01012557.1/.p1  ORF type:complete len:430 (+),score=90.66 gb/GECH01012557.1/:1-1290(+)
MMPNSTLGSTSFDQSQSGQLSFESSFGMSNSKGGITLEEWKQRFMGVIHKAEVDLLYACMGNQDPINVIKDSMQGLKGGVIDLLEMLSSLVEKLIQRYKKSATKTNKYWEAAMDDMKDRLANEKRSTVLEADRRKRLQTEVKKLRNQLNQQRRTMIRSMNGSHGVRRSATAADNSNIDAVNTKEFEEEKESTMSTEPERLYISQRNNAAESTNSSLDSSIEKNDINSSSHSNSPSKLKSTSASTSPTTSPSPSPTSQPQSPQYSPRPSSASPQKTSPRLNRNNNGQSREMKPANTEHSEKDNKDNSPSSILKQKVRNRIDQNTKTDTKEIDKKKEPQEQSNVTEKEDSSDSLSPRARLQERIRSRLGQRSVSTGSTRENSGGESPNSNSSNHSASQRESSQESQQSRSESLRANLRARLERRKSSPGQS